MFCRSFAEVTEQTVLSWLELAAEVYPYLDSKSILRFLDYN